MLFEIDDYQHFPNHKINIKTTRYEIIIAQTLYRNQDVVVLVNNDK